MALIPEAKALLYKVQSFMKQAGIPTYATTRTVDEDSYIYVLCAETQNILLISVAPTVPDAVYREEEQPEVAEFPDFLSGAIYDGLLEQVQIGYGRQRDTKDVCTGFSPTPECAAFHELPLARQVSARLAVRPPNDFFELSNREPPPVFSQYTRLRPSMYSGTMKSVVQCVLGLGKIDPRALRDPKRPRRTQYMTDVETNGVQIRYDYKFSRTHGITKGEDGRLWLVEISSNRGVLVRPLPAFPGSDHPSFLTEARARGDEALVYAVEQFGCLPTGEAFPVPRDTFNRLIERGEIQQLLTPSDLSEFYRCSPYSSAMGWAFNDDGTEAHNTAYYYAPDGYQRGVWYQINISIGAIRENWRPGEPLAPASATLVKMEEGPIYTRGLTRSPTAYVPLKFYEPLLPGLISHQALATRGAVGDPPNSDTTMFVSFVNGRFRQVKYYFNMEEGTYEEINDPRYDGECKVDNTWVITEKRGNRNIPRMMYTNDYDHRRTLHEVNVVTTIRSSSEGYDPPQFSDFIEAPNYAFVHRDKIWRIDTHIDRQGGEVLQSAVVIPAYSREAYMYAVGNMFADGRSITDSVSYLRIRDPNVGYAWRCFPRISSPPIPPECRGKESLCGGACNSVGEGVHKERRVICLGYEPGECTDHADSGPWLSLCTIVDGFGGGRPRHASSVSTPLGYDEKAEAYLVTPGFGGAIKLPITFSDVTNHWIWPSPDPVTGITQFASAMHNCLGRDLVVYNEGISTYNSNRQVVGTLHDDATPMPCLIGVIR